MPQQMPQSPTTSGNISQVRTVYMTSKFNPFGDARAKFEIRYYLVAILFIIFDLDYYFYSHELFVLAH